MVFRDMRMVRSCICGSTPTCRKSDVNNLCIPDDAGGTSSNTDFIVLAWTRLWSVLNGQLRMLGGGSLNIWAFDDQASFNNDVLPSHPEALRTISRPIHSTVQLVC